MSERETPSDLWAGAVVEYERQTERKIDGDHEFRDLQSLHDLKNKLDRETGRFNAFRSEHHRLYSAIAKCFQPMEPILSIVQETIQSTPYAPISAVFGAAKYLLQACDSVTKAYDGIEELFEQMNDITVRLEKYDCSGMESSLQAKMTDILAYFLVIIGKAEACIKRGRIKQWAKSVFTKDDGIQSSVNKLRNYMEAELGLVIALTYKSVNSLQASTTDMHATLKLTNARTDELLSMQRSDRERTFSEAEEKSLSDSLRTKTVDELAREHVGNLEKLTKGTGLWIKDDDMFQAWEQENVPILWVLGKPGVGKTMLAARTIQMLQDMYPQHPDIPSLTSVSYLYFKDDNPALQDCANMWKTAAFQITRANDRFKKYVIATINKRQDCLASARRIWQHLFLDFFTEPTPSSSATSLAFIIVDGIDEGPEAERVKFLSCLADLVDRRTKSYTCRIQVAVFARPSVLEDPGFEKVGFSTQDRKIQVTPDRNRVDIETFTQQQLSNVSVLKILKRRRSKEYQILAKQIYHSVHSRSQGMFLWAKLTFDQIRDLPSPEAVRQSLLQVPKGLDDMLYHIFKRLETHEQMGQSYLKDLISWVLCARRPLYVSELFALILVIANHHYYLIEDHLKARYSSLFEVTGPLAGLEQYEEEVRRFPDDSTPEEDQFNFLKEGDLEGSDGDPEGVQSLTDEIVPTASGANQDPVSIPGHWYQTTITFAHARIRDYLTVQANPSTRRWDDCAIVPADLNLTRLSIVHHLLSILSTDIAEEHSVHSLKAYAKTFWVKHLEELDFTRIDEPDAVHLARRLSRLFQSGHRMLEMCSRENDAWWTPGHQFLDTWLSTSRYSGLVREIITKHLEALDGQEQDWVSSVTRSARALFQPLVTACARKWLTKSGWDDVAYLDKSEPEVCVMYAFSLLTDEGTNDGSVNMSNIFIGNIPLDAIESIADIEPVQKSEHYYTSIAWTMMEAGYLAGRAVEYAERAIEHFRKAVELKPGGWVAMEGLAICYGEHLHEFETAIQYMEDAKRNIPQTEDFQANSFYLEARIPGWTLQLGNDQESVNKAQTVYEGSRKYDYGRGDTNDGSILRSIKNYTEALYRTRNYDGFIELLYELDQRVPCGRQTSLWTLFIQAQYASWFNNLIFDKVGTITRIVKSDALQSFMRASIKKSIKLDAESIAQGESHIWLADQAAQWQYSYAPQREESIELWESIVALVDQSNGNVQQSQAAYRTGAAAYLSMMYFDVAKNSQDNGGDFSAHISKLKNLAKHRQGSKQYYRASYPALVYGMWLHEHANAEEESWKECIRPSIKQALYLLSDEDPWNDQRAYVQLGQALLLGGDILNASIALGISTKPLEEQSKSPQQSDDKENTYELVPTAGQVAEHQVGDSTASYLQNTDSTTAQDVPVDAFKDRLAQGEEGPKTDGVITAPADRDDDNNNNKSTTASTTTINPKYTGFECVWRCDSPRCETPQQSSYAELHVCRVCHDVSFCDQCIPLVRTDALPFFRRCASHHPFVRVFPMVEGARRVTDALVERRFEVQQGWLEGLRRVWEG